MLLYSNIEVNQLLHTVMETHGDDMPDNGAPSSDGINHGISQVHSQDIHAYSSTNGGKNKYSYELHHKSLRPGSKVKSELSE